MLFKLFKKKRTVETEIAVNKEKSEDTRKIPMYDFDSILKSYEEDQQLNLSLIFWGLLSKNDNIRYRCTNIIKDEVLNKDNMHLIRLDKEFRQKTSMGWYYDWREEPISNVLVKNIDLDSKIAVLGLSSFHPSGYFREKAIKALIELDDIRTVPFLILRLNDWVDIIRYKTQKYFEGYINESSIREILINLELFNHTKNYGRINSNDILDKIKCLINERILLELIDDIYFLPKKSKIVLYVIIMEKKIFDSVKLIDIVLQESSNDVRFLVFSTVVPELTDTELIDYRDKLLADFSYRVRVLTIRELVKRGVIKSYEEMLFGLRDRFASVRDITRYYLRRFGFEQFGDYYLRVLEENSNDYIAMIGLSEVAKKEHFDALVSQLTCKKVVVVKKTLKAMSTLDFEKAYIHVLVALEDKRIGVSNEAKRVLIENKGYYDADDIYKIYLKEIDFIVKRNASTILCGTTKWASISYIMELLNSDENEIVTIAETALGRWIACFNNSFTKPSKNQYKNFVQIFDKNKEKLSESDKLWFEKLIEDYKE